MLLLAVLLTASAGPTLAARPFTTDDAGVTAPGQCQADLFAAHGSAHDAPALDATWLQANCGVLNGTALGLGYGYARSDGAADHAWVLTGKTALNAPADSQPAYALSLAGASLRGHDQAMHFDSLSATLIASAPLDGGWTLHANFGWTYAHPARRSAIGVAIAAERQWSNGVRAGLETSINDRDHAPWSHAGMSLPLGAGWSANASWGLQIGRSRARLATLGLTKDF